MVRTAVGYPDDDNPYRRMPGAGIRRSDPSNIIIPFPQADGRDARIVAKEMAGMHFRALTAAAQRIEPNEKDKYASYRPSSASWQSEAWALADQVGELRYAANLYGNSLSRIRLELTRKNDKGKQMRLCDLSPDELTAADRLAMDVMADFYYHQSAEEMQRLWGINKFIVGEALLVGLPEKDPKRRGKGLLDYCFKIYSRDDVKEQPSGALMICGKEYDPSEVLLIRLWQPHPRLSREADSPVRASLPVIRELVGLTMFVSAIIDSRLAGAGILLLPNSATVLGSSAPEDDQEEDPTVAALIESMITPIKDRDSAASVVPLVLTAPDESVDAIRHISFASQLEGAAKDLRDEAIRRLALGMDMPPEVLLGAGETSSHWGAWMVQEDNVKLHAIPGVRIFADAVLKEFLHPVLLGAGESDDTVELYNFEAVADHMYSRPNKFEEALELYKVDALNLTALLQAGGFQLSDAPEKKDDVDRAVDLALKAVAINPSLFQDPGLPQLVSQLRAVLSGQDAGSAPEEANPKGALWKDSQVNAAESEGRAPLKDPAKGMPATADKKKNEPGPAQNRPRDGK